AQQVQLNEEDQANIQQITAMGIPEERATMAYIMCGRNVEMAIQYYFENPDEFDEGA
ncbi:UV excision repair protein rad23, partial [Tilletia horrida]